ncbi:MAG: TonB-dependent receptor, partial [Candidatus Neomarinimicrobiota bacterium]
MHKRLLIVLTGLIFAFETFAGTSGKITGRVSEAANGKPLAGVNVIIEGTTMGAATDLDGYFIILNIPVGTYRAKATMIGYTSMIVENIVVSIDLTTNINFALTSTVLEAGESVVVTAQRPLMRKDEFTSRHTVTAEEMTVQPVDNFQQIARNQAGTVGSHFRGGRIGEVLVVIDGLPVKDPAGEYSGNMGGFTADVPEAAIQEMEVTLGGFSAEYGNVQSGVLNLALKEGGRKFSGKARVMSTNFGSDLNDLLMGERSKWLGVTYLHKLENNYQFSLNGPLLPNIANFSASAEITDRTQGNFINENSFNQSYQGKLTIKPTSKTKLAFGALYSKRDWDEFYLPA